jgi:hypothetical protein
MYHPAFQYSMKSCFRCIALLLFLCTLGIFSGCTTMTLKKDEAGVPLLACQSDSAATLGEAEIWALENAYFSNLYKADYDSVLSLVHSRFLGWPDGLDQPLDYNESARYMKRLVTGPTSCTITIEREGIRVHEDIALTQYILHATCRTTNETAQVKSSEITHTWVKEASGWKLLGGMSRDR